MHLSLFESDASACLIFNKKKKKKSYIFEIVLILWLKGFILNWNWSLSSPALPSNNLFLYSMSKQYLIGQLLHHVTQASPPGQCWTSFPDD